MFAIGEGYCGLPLLHSKVLVLVPMPMVGWRQQVLIRRYGLEVPRSMSSLDLQHALALRRRDPFRTPYAVVLDQLMLGGDIRAADVEASVHSEVTILRETERCRREREREGAERQICELRCVVYLNDHCYLVLASTWLAFAPLLSRIGGSKQDD